MADNGSTSSQRSGSQREAGPSDVPKAIGSLARKQSDVTRLGTQRLKFVPTLPARRKKEDVKPEPSTESVQPSTPGRDGRGRGRGRGGGGEPRGATPRPAQVEMTASGPFAMGPVLAGTSARRTALRSNFTPIVPQGPTASSSPGGKLSTVGPSQLKKEKQRENVLENTVQKEIKTGSDEEVYSEPDEGVQIVDMEDVGGLDWMAPETLRNERRDRQKKKLVKTEIEEPLISTSSKGKAPEREIMKHEGTADSLEQSESEEEAEIEDLIADFAFQADIGQEEDVRQERLYLFQFPEPFFTFVKSTAPHSATPMDVDTPDSRILETKQRKVSFAADVKPPAPITASSSAATADDDPSAQKDSPKVDGIIGQLEVYRSGAVKMRLGNDILLNVSEATQASFLQQAVHLEMENKRLHVIGEINKRYVVSPDLDALLSAMEAEDNTSAMVPDDLNLIKMDP
ncbi:RNA polymerase III RPC4-domain-containing protein [Pisolithus sp. B1]|nr:RNA polymerase III RPC4-domain-containing protein [Pisolithus sp. B1]